MDAATLIWRAGQFNDTALLDWAVRNGVFETTVAPASAADVAVATGAIEHKVRPMLDGLSGLGFLKTDGERYVNTEMTCAHLVDGAPDDLRAFVVHMGTQWRRWSNADDLMRASEVMITHQDRSVFEDHAAHELLLRATAQECGDLPGVVVELLADCGACHVLDAGGGHGRFAAEFAARLPAATCEVWDTPLTRDLVGTSSGAGVEYQGCDLFDPSTWPAGSFDLILLSNVVANVTLDRASTLVAELATRLGSGGTFVLISPWLEASRATPESSALFGVLLSLACADAFVPTVSDCSAMLIAAGLSVRSVERFRDDAVLIGTHASTQGGSSHVDF